MLSQILHFNNVSGSKLLLEGLLFRCRNDVISVTRQFASPARLCAGWGRSAEAAYHADCTWPPVLCFNTDMML